MIPPRYARVLHEGELRYVRVGEDEHQLLDAAPWRGGSTTGERVPAGGALACPVEPTKILGVGRNYRAHAAELGNELPTEPLLFLKPPSSLVGPGAAIELPPESARVDYEGELGVVIGRRARRVSREDALGYVFGLTVVCDVTARDLQKKDGQWARAKGFDGFCPTGPVVVSGLAPAPLALELRVNGEVRQSASTALMVFDVARVIEHASACMTLEPGDLLATGTPEGIGALAAGDRVEVSVEGVGTLAFSVRA